MTIYTGKLAGIHTTLGLVAWISYPVLWGACGSSGGPVSLDKPSAGIVKESTFFVRGSCMGEDDVTISGDILEKTPGVCKEGSFDIRITLTGGEGDKHITARQGGSKDQRTFTFQNPVHQTIDLLGIAPTGQGLRRVFGSVGNGSHGTPVAGGVDVDGDGHLDYALSSMRASTNTDLPPNEAGLVFVVFGDGTTSGPIDTSIPLNDGNPPVLQVLGENPKEVTGSEIWMAEVTGDQWGDILIARQNYTPPGGPIGAGALTVIVGGPALRDLVTNDQVLNLGSAPDEIAIVHFVGEEEFGRLGIWMRAGDVTGDGVDDIAVGADQQSVNAQPHQGLVYLVRGGTWMAETQTVRLADFGEASSWATQIAKLVPPPGLSDAHFGATVQIADLDNNGTAEVLAASTLDRAGGVLLANNAPEGSAHGRDGVNEEGDRHPSRHGVLHILWDDNFGTPWTGGMTILVANPPGSVTRILGREGNKHFGEELLGGLDFDNDGHADLFVGDIEAGFRNRIAGGSGHIFYQAQQLRGLDFDIGNVPPEITMIDIFGAGSGHIAGDTAAGGDFDGDGIHDLAFCSPHAAPLGRTNAGTVHILFGRNHPWPNQVDLAGLPDPVEVRTTILLGARGDTGSDSGDVLCYSAASADIDKDGKTDLLINEMLGNGSDEQATSDDDVGNLLVVSGDLLAGDN